MLDLTEPSATDPCGIPLPPKTAVRLSSSEASPTRVDVPCPSMRETVAGSTPALCQARAIASRCPTGFGAVIPLPLPSLEPPIPSSTA